MTSVQTSLPRYRIGELARRAGVTTDLLRAWERRYALLRPARSPGGFRLYSEDDAARVARMRANLSAGMSAAEAARVALAVDAERDGGGGAPAPEGQARRLRSALDRLDEDEAQSALDALIGSLSLDSVLRDVVLPYLHDLGERWAAGETSVAYEHFASNVLRGRMLALARGWGRGGAPTALLACAPGELHDLPLIALGLALRARGWRVVFLGPDTPVPTLADAATDVEPAVVVVSGVIPERFVDAKHDLAALAADFRLAIGGAGAAPEIAEAVGAHYLGDNPVTAADALAAVR
jgi:MerR family transcriptional regulator, light-induced transcriptional regulator